jgi:hypothetical protein
VRRGKDNVAFDLPPHPLNLEGDQVDSIFDNDANGMLLGNANNMEEELTNQQGIIAQPV